MTDFEAIKFEQQGAIARISLDRPDAANGLNRQMADDLERAARLCDSDPELKVVILAASGRFFCAGGDIKEMHAHGDAIGRELKALADTLHRSISTLCRMSPALVIAVNGVAAGAGFSLALIGDIVLAAQSASFTMAYTRAGLCPDGSSTWFLPRLVGLRKAQELMLANTTLDADEARALGIVSRVVADDELEAESWRIARDLAAGARGSTASVRRLLLTSFDNSLETQMEFEGRALARCAASQDGREGIRAFIDKTKPEFE